jgi:dipeptidyl aminopeptidase/acylaminoacyl peptidase
MKKFIFILLAIPFLLFAQTKRAINVEDLWSMKRIGSFDLSPDNKTIAFTAQSFSMEDNKGNTDIFLINSDGSNMRSFKSSAKNETEPKFSPDGNKIAFIRDSQIWTANLDGSGEEQITNLHTGASGIVWSNDGKKILFKSSVHPECATDECNRKKDEAAETSKVKARLFTELMYRHWNDWRGEKRSHLFVIDLDSKKAVDINLNSPFDVPPIALGSSNDYGFSPSGDEIAYTQNRTEMLATSTNNDIFIVSVKDIKEGIEAPARKISVSEGNDNQPVYSPDGRYIAFLSMERAGFEADKLDIIIFDRENGTQVNVPRGVMPQDFSYTPGKMVWSSGTHRNILRDIDYSAGEIIWSPASDAIFFTAANEIYNSIFRIDIFSGKISEVIKETYANGITLSADGKRIFYKKQSSTLPYEIFVSDINGKNTRQITNVNGDLLAQLQMNDAETFWSEGAEGAKVQSILVKPPFFDEKKRYPMIFLIHGGPQGNWSDNFHFRWNVQMFASKGYVVVAPNPRGSTGYGQKFTDEISGDWGGKVYTDLMNAYDHAVEKIPFIDRNNTFAAGASYGGYMVNWIAGHTDRFNALVSHAGVFNLESKYGTTEELWFPEWEFGGPPWEKREVYEKWSPHRYIHNATTPMLIIHGAYDFRVSEEQAFQLFTSLQRLGVESRFLYFPDEFHFITKPQNARLWWNTIFDWYQEHLTTENP